MTPEQHDFATALTAAVRNLALLTARIADLHGFADTAHECRQIADDIRDAHNQLEGL